MRRSVFTLVALLILGAFVHVMALTSNTYNSTLNGQETTHRLQGEARLSMSSSGDLPGSFNLTLKYRADNTVESGNWTLTVYEQAGDDSNTRGTLSGTVSGGTLTFDADGKVSTLNSVQLTITGGTQLYAGVSSGGGAMQGNASQGAASPLTGSLSLTF